MASPNLLSRDFEVTARFDDKPGFAETWHEDGWLILKRGDLLLDYFSHSELDAATSGFRYGFQLANVGTFFNAMLAADNSEQATGRACAHRSMREACVGTVGTLIADRSGRFADRVDPDRRPGSDPLLRPRSGDAVNRCARDAAHAP